MVLVFSCLLKYVFRCFFRFCGWCFCVLVFLLGFNLVAFGVFLLCVDLLLRFVVVVGLVVFVR